MYLLHVVSVENKPKINIAVYGIYVVSVENKAKINICVNWAHVMGVESFNSSEVNHCNSYCSLLYSTSSIAFFLCVFYSTLAVIYCLILPCMIKPKVTSSCYLCKTLDTHDMNPIDSNVNFCCTLNTHGMSSNHNSN